MAAVRYADSHLQIHLEVEEGFRLCDAARIGSASTGTGVTEQDLDLAHNAHLAMMSCSR